ncbi:MAG TPA: ABC transporter permease subunit [Candidatus Limnocylindria bacterium]|jgi:ABC-2 type transport system permease protein
MTLRLFWQTLAWNRARLALLLLACLGWGVLIPIIYTGFSDAIREMVNSGMIPENLMSFGSGNFFTLPGALTLGLQHPLAIAFVGVFALGSPVTAVAGERERGTLEVLLSRPLSRQRHYTVVALAVLLMLALAVAALLIGQVSGAVAVGIADELDLGLLPLVFLNGVLMWGAFASVALAASVSFDRAGPAMGVALGFLLTNYFFEILGSLWDAAEFLQPYSLFHHFDPGQILQGDGDPLDFAVCAVALVIPAVWALMVYPRRDLAAPA